MISFLQTPSISQINLMIGVVVLKIIIIISTLGLHSQGNFIVKY